MVTASNVAARLESLAAPGGICISSSVHEQLANKLAISYEDLGEQTVSNRTLYTQLRLDPLGRVFQTSIERYDSSRDLLAARPFIIFTRNPEIIAQQIDHQQISACLAMRDRKGLQPSIPTAMSP
jgi:hypothetical protein